METPKDKAKELVEKYQNVNQPEGYDCIAESTVIECAKIAVDELMENDCGGCRESNRDYWQEVKNELNKML